MNKKVRCIAIDNGGSEIRIKSAGSSDSDILAFDNDVVYIEEKDFRVKDVPNGEVVCRIVDSTDTSYCGIYASSLVGKAFENISIAIDNQGTKTGNDNFYKQMIYGISLDVLRAFKADLQQKFGSDALAKMSDIQSAVAQYADSLEYEYGVVACIPIREYNGSKDCAELLKSRVEGHYVVEFPFVEGEPTISFNIAKENIGVVPEGGVAITALSKNVSDSAISLIVDMGHVTTDIALFCGKSLLGRAISSPYAGGTLIGNLRSVLNDEGYFLTEEQAERVVATDTVMRGAKEVSVKEIMDIQRKQFVTNYIQKEIIQVLIMNGINAKQVQYFIPIGALMNSKDKENSIEYNILRSCGLVYAQIIYFGDDLRYVNIKQAGKFADHMLKKMESAKRSVVVV